MVKAHTLKLKIPGTFKQGPAAKDAMSKRPNACIDLNMSLESVVRVVNFKDDQKEPLKLKRWFQLFKNDGVVRISLKMHSLPATLASAEDTWAVQQTTPACYLIAVQDGLPPKEKCKADTVTDFIDFTELGAMKSIFCLNMNRDSRSLAIDRPNLENACSFHVKKDKIYKLTGKA